MNDTVKGPEYIDNDELAQEAAAAKAEQIVQESEEQINSVPGHQANETNQENEPSQGALIAASDVVGEISVAVHQKWPIIEYDKPRQEEISKRLALVMDKYQLGIPEELKAWEEEIRLAFILASTGLISYMQIKAYKQQQQKQDQEEKKSDKKPAATPTNADLDLSQQSQPTVLHGEE